MGVSWSNNNTNTNRRRNTYLDHPPPPPLPPPYYYSHPPPLLPPPPPPQGYFFTSPNPSATTYVAPPHYYSNGYSPNSAMGRQYQQPFYANQVQVQVQVQGEACLPPPPPYVDCHSAKKIRNDVNLHKHTLRLHVDPNNPDHHLVSFVFDALYDGSITILYLAKEEEKCRFVPLFPYAFVPLTFPFQKGVGQKFCQPSGTGIDLSFFDLDDLSNPSFGEDVFPLVICAETLGNSMLDASPHMQITQAVLEKNNGSGRFQVKVVRQILWIDEVRYELRELYGMGNSTAADFDDNDLGKECVICMTEPKDTAVLPCRHMCMCSECANALRFQSNKCPICRQPIEELIEIKINNGYQ